MNVSPQSFQILVIAKALEVYARHKLRVNRDYTPGAMLRVASRLTGQEFKRGQYLVAAAALRSLLP